MMTADQSPAVPGPAAEPLDEAGEPGVDAEIQRLGITPVVHTVYEWGGFRYGNARDAIAAARRAPR